VLTGTADADRLDGAFGNDTLSGLAGADILIGGIGNDSLNGGADADSLFGGDGDDTFAFHAVGDLAAGETISGGDGALDEIALFNGGSHNLAPATISGIEQLRFGGAGAALLSGAQIGAGLIANVVGSGGSDTLTVSGAAVDLSGVSFASWTSGSDLITINGTAGADNLTGSSRNDTLIGFGGVDVMAGGAGDDRYFVDTALDSVTEAAGGANGFDSLFATVSYTIAANVERLYLQGSGNINATGLDGQNDYLYGNAGRNILNGKAGSDYMSGGLGDDSYYVNTSGDVVIEAAGAAAGFDTIFAQTSFTIAANVERLYLLNGGSYNGNGRNGQNDFLAGNTSANILNGFSGNDTIRGGLGNDTLTGGAGLDIFQFLTAAHTVNNHDTITDFNIADDTIQMDNLVYALLGANGALADNLFKNLTLAAQDADDRVLYDQTTGNLYYDINGLAAGGRTLFADVSDGLALTSLDFFVV
jgi:Ca2+-binding RTX toxin-like protein